MSVSVITRSQCDRCGKVAEVAGAHAGVPPQHWAQVDILFRGVADGWQDGTRHAWVMCGECAMQVKSFAYAHPLSAYVEGPVQ